jgi:hypothetical protein
MAVRRGVHKPLEDEANRIIRESLKDVTKHSEKSDILTPWKESERHRREVYVSAGVPDASTRKGMFHRVVNATRPELNSRDGICRPRNIGGTLANHVDESGDFEDPSD